MEWLLLLFRTANYVISIEKEGIVIGCPRILFFKPSNSGQLYSIAVHIFCDVVFLSTSLRQSIADVSLIIAKLINLTVKNILLHIPLNIHHTE